MLEESRSVWMAYGVRYVLMSGTTGMLLLCVDNYSTMEVSYNY